VAPAALVVLHVSVFPRAPVSVQGCGFYRKRKREAEEDNKELHLDVFVDEGVVRERKEGYSDLNASFVIDNIDEDEDDENGGSK